MSKKEEFVGIRISRELKTVLQKKAVEKGISLSRLIEETLNDNLNKDPIGKFTIGVIRNVINEYYKEVNGKKNATKEKD